MSKEKEAPKKCLAGVNRSVTQRPPRIVIYGPGGIGKTTFGAMAPSPILIPIEDGLGMLEVDHFPLVTSYGQLEENLSTLFTEEHDYKTVVIDSADWMERIIWEAVSAHHGVDSIEQVLKGFGKGYVEAIKWWANITSALTALRDHRNMMTIIICHAQIKRFDNPMSEPYDRYMMKLQDKARELLFEWADATLFAGYRVHTKSTEVKGGQKITRGIGDSQRCLFTTEAPGWLAKNRYALPDELPLDFNAFMDALAGK